MMPFHLRATLVLLALCLQACSSIEPWVKPYERENFAHPTMQVQRNPHAARFREHVYTTRGAARGASSGSGGGCGCN